ncbi:MAG: hypothetical protein EOP45_22420 [Sphingobacteriaceae bacterium]|nr:MAG: hypothetical protein EOP45_22420 [Sphingobacteriaceae bacterium]
MFEALACVDDVGLSDDDLQAVSDLDEVDLVDNLELNNMPSNFDVKEGSIFLEKTLLVNSLKMISIKNNFEFKVSRSSKSRYFIVCNKQPCDWKLSASVCGDSGVWVIRKYQKEHTCVVEVVSAKHRQASASLISECVKREFYNGRAGHMVPNDVVDHMRTHYKVNISYFTAWKGRDLALKEVLGSHATSYSLLQVVAEMIAEKNQGSVLFLFWFLSLIVIQARLKLI